MKNPYISENKIKICEERFSRCLLPKSNRKYLRNPIVGKSPQNNSFHQILFELHMNTLRILNITKLRKYIIKMCWQFERRKANLIAFDVLRKVWSLHFAREGEFHEFAHDFRSKLSVFFFFFLKEIKIERWGVSDKIPKMKERRTTICWYLSKRQCQNRTHAHS